MARTSTILCLSDVVNARHAQDARDIARAQAEHARNKAREIKMLSRTAAGRAILEARVLRWLPPQYRGKVDGAHATRADALRAWQRRDTSKTFVGAEFVFINAEEGNECTIASQAGLGIEITPTPPNTCQHRNDGRGCCTDCGAFL